MPLSACGDDDGETGASTTTETSTSPTSSTTTSADSGSTAAATTDEPSTSTSPASSSDATAADSTTGGPAGDPTYPPIDGGSCPAGTAPVMLPGSELCAPFCGSADDVCPMAASGDAPAECTPFAGAGGSGDPCDDVTPCPAGETCRQDGTCAEVAFWACQLLCGDGQTCPDGMGCSGIGTCGYP